MQIIIIFVVLIALAVFLYSKSLKKLSKIFNNWEEDIHEKSEQRVRIYRALHDGLSLHRFIGDESAEIVGKSGEIYEVSLHNCTCPDFEERQLPCKHMYFLAKELKKISKFELSFCSDEPKKKKNNSKQKEEEKFSTHGATFTITSSFEVRERPIKKIKLNYDAINKVVEQKNDSYYGYTGMYNFEVRGTNEKTNRRKKVEVKGTSEQGAERNAKARGIFPPYEIKQIPYEPDVEQLEYANQLGIKVPKLCCRDDISALIRQVEDNDTILVSPDLLAFGRKRGIYLSSFTGEKSAYGIIFCNLTGADKIATFAFMLYKHFTKDIVTNFEDCRYKDKFISFGQQQLENEQFTKSFKKLCSKYEHESDVLHFEPYINEFGIKASGISKKTFVYRTTFEFLKQNNMI